MALKGSAKTSPKERGKTNAMTLLETQKLVVGGGGGGGVCDFNIRDVFACVCYAIFIFL